MDRTPLIPRRPLVESLVAATFAAIEAPGGYGKSTLVQLAHEHAGATTVSCTLDRPHTAEALRAAIAAAARRIGLTGLAEVVAAPDASATDVAATISRRGGPLRIVVDDVQFADDESAAWLVTLGGALHEPAALVVAGRRLPSPVVAAVRTGAATLVSEDALRFTERDVADLVGALAPGIRPDDGPLVGDVLAMTGGWPVAVTMAVSAALAERARPGADRSNGAGTPDDPIGSPIGDRASLVRRLVHRLIVDSSVDDRRRLAALAAVPMLDDAVARIVAGDGALNLVRDVGIPLVTTPDGWRRLADPVRDVLRDDAALDGTARRAVAAYLATRGHLGQGLSLLHRVDDHRGAAELLRTRGWRELRALGLVTVDLALSELPDAVMADALPVFLAAARAAELTDHTRRRAWLRRAERLASALDDQVTLRAVKTELAREAVRVGDLDDAVAMATDVLATATPAERHARARALVCLAHVDTVRATPSDLALAEARLEEAIARFRSLGDTDWEADALLRLGYAVSYQGGRPERAVEQLGRCLALLPEPDRSRGNALSHVAEVLGVVGRPDEAEALAREGMAIGRTIGDPWVVAACAWSAMIVAAHRGDLAATRWWIEQIEGSPGTWTEVGAGAEFLVEASDVLASLGDEEGARRYHQRAARRTTELGIPEALHPVTGRIESTFGDPFEAERILAAVEGSAFAVVRTRWLRYLLRAQAADRRGDHEAARDHAAAAVRELDRIGDRSMPWRSERRLAQRLAHLLPDSPKPGTPSWHLTLLGGWKVDRDGEDATPPAGRPSQLVKWLALRGPSPIDEAIELLWPDTEPVLGRSRLRNLLHRLKERTGELVVRRDEVLALASTATVDVAQFSELARDALGAGGDRRVGLARGALALFAGDLLVGDVYEAWTAAPREQLRRVRLALVDLVARDAMDRGDLDEALTLLDVAVTLEPLDERRWLMAADALVRQGRRRSAAELLERAASTFEEAGVPARLLLDRRGSLIAG